MADRLSSRCAERIATERRNALERRIPAIQQRDGLRYRLHGRQLVSFCSNDYLGYASEAPAANPAPEPLGSSASRLVCGESPPLRELESAFAEFLGSGEAIYFPTAYQLNVGLFRCLLQAGDELYSDQLNHASLVDGMRGLAVSPTILPHLQPPPHPTPTPGTAPLRFWVLEAAYSMDGDGPESDKIRAAIEQGYIPIIDEAHTYGLGDGGHGRFTRDLHGIAVLPLGKAAGAMGAFLAADAEVCRYIRTHHRGLVYSTAPPPNYLRQLTHRIRALHGPDGTVRRQRLAERCAQFQTILQLSPRVAPIFPFAAASNAAAVHASEQLLAAGFHVQAIRPPTVPPNGARLRVTLSADHEPDEVEALAQALQALVSARALRLDAGP